MGCPTLDLYQKAIDTAQTIRAILQPIDAWGPSPLGRYGDAAMGEYGSMSLPDRASDVFVAHLKAYTWIMSILMVLDNHISLRMANRPAVKKFPIPKFC